MARPRHKKIKASVPSPQHPSTLNHSPKSASEGTNNHSYEDENDGEELNPGPWLSDHKDKPDLASMPVRRPNPKEWFPPQIDGNHTTFIDYGCERDEEEYPLHPNGQTTFVGYSKHSAITYRGNHGPPKEEKKEDVEEVAEDGKKNENWIWKTTRYFCLGALTCDNRGCEWAGSPPTCRLKLGSLPKVLKTMTCPGLAGHCLGKVTHLKCDDTALCFDEPCKGFGLLRHKGCHNHPWPEAKKPDPLTLAKFATAVETTQRLLGKPGHEEGDTFESATTFYPASQNKDCVAYYWRRILVGYGLKPDKLGGGIGDKFILNMFGWSSKGLVVISLSFMPGEEHFSFQTPWMANRLVARDKDNKLYSGGFLLDVTYRYFENGYLMTTSMYCGNLNRWVPVQFTWI
ncbi:hypothetical protein PSTG_17103 [Puccinia striiformis f. sp. tritici PST-78]|uniref:Uncharacterized protein n=1 Tax=Puccinia striiformis f. sp. tritici PST-78 TaxID=1165861 RepID=A0A0L0URR1_9BASI|nr:hypothetical protein PSTG_17103 [Puccinia striiformis f. sp. tritici PST-78]